MLFVCGAFAQSNDIVLNRPYADQKRIHFGFSVGLVLHDLNISNNGFVTETGESWFADVPNHSPGFAVGVLADLRLSTHLNLRLAPGMQFGSKTIHFKNVNALDAAIETQNIKSTWVVVPIDLKISSLRWKNLRPYVTAGVMGILDVSKSRSEQLKVKNTDLMLTVGFGCDFYLPFFKFCPEVKFGFGLRDILQRKRPDLDDNPEMMKYTESVSKMSSNMVAITFYFE